MNQGRCKIEIDYSEVPKIQSKGNANICNEKALTTCRPNHGGCDLRVWNPWRGSMLHAVFALDSNSKTTRTSVNLQNI